VISILIPCFNYPSFKLVEELYRQCVDLQIPFEILVSEDAGHSYLSENHSINSLKNCQYKIYDKNLGRAGNINRLLKSAKFKIKLILDCDVMPKSEYFIKNYISIAKNKKAFACFGGITYQKQIDKNSLRLNYGIKREAKLATSRKKNPYKYLLTSNLLLVNVKQYFDERIKTYGYEDLVFSQQLFKKNIPAIHLDNPVYHCNLETNKAFLNKTQIAIETLINLEKKELLKSGETNISKLYHGFRRFHLHYLIVVLNAVMSHAFFSVLVKRGKPIWMFDLYKLLYFSKVY